MGKITTKLPGTRILLAEDYFINQELTKDLLELMECEVDIAEDGREALKLFEENEYDLILMDIQMPNLDGYEATKQIRAKEASSKKHIPIVALTANAMQGDEQKCLDAGMDSYISKPLDPQLLEEILKKFLSKDAQVS